MLLTAVILAQSLSLIAGDENVRALPPSFPYTSNAGVDLGCLGALVGSRFPSQIYDRVHDERIMYNVSRCSGGYIHATNETTGKSWNIQIGPGGRLNGRDLAGAKWKYDRPRKTFVNLKTHVECTTPDYRAMCGDTTG
ncbi:MAG: hypothetical protein INR64_02895 [Caulobacteraceae bacterium]|nr:hypothetical protein [Caulobacter sp.]